MLFLIYLLKVSACMAVFYGLYFFAFRKFTFHTLNRFYLLCTLLLSFIIPLISFETTKVVKVEPSIVVEEIRLVNTPVYSSAHAPTGVNEAIAIVTSADETPDWRFYMVLCYSLVAAALLISFLIKLFKIYQLGRKAVNVDNLRIVQRSGQLTNASFFNLIFLNTNGLTDNEKAQIIAHECVHIRQLHSIDILLIEICKIILWFNPIIYFYKKSLIDIHEFEADLNTIQQFDSKNYAHLLLKLGINHNLDLTNPFSLHPLSARIQFLFKERTITAKKIFYTLGLPVLALGIFAFAQPNEKLIYEAAAKASKEINSRIASLSEALKSLEIDSTAKQKRMGPLVSTNPIDSGRYQLIANPFLLKMPEVPYPDPYNKTFYVGDINLIIGSKDTPEILSFDFFGEGKLITEGAKAEDVHIFQEDRELLAGKDFEFIYETNRITKALFSEDVINPYKGLRISVKQTSPPRPINKDSFFLLKRSPTPDLKSPWRYKTRIHAQQNFNTDTLRTYMPANFLGKDPLVIINGCEYHPRILQSLNFREGYSYVAKPNDPRAIDKYGIKAQDGVVDLNTSSSFEFDSERKRQVALENVRRELSAYQLYKNEKIVKVRLLDDEGKEFERRIIRGFIDDRIKTIDLPLDGVIEYRINGKIVSEADVINHKEPFTSSAYSVNDYYAWIDLRTK